MQDLTLLSAVRLSVSLAANLVQLRVITGSHLSLHIDRRRFQGGHVILGLGVEFMAEIAQLIAQCLEVLQQQVVDFYAGWRQKARPDPVFPKGHQQARAARFVRHRVY